MDLRKFRPLWAVALLTNKLEENTAFLQRWALAQLLAWAILDQRPGKRLHRNSDKTPTKPKIRTVNAKQAGQITLAYLLDRYLARVQGGSVTIDPEVVSVMSFSASLQRGGAKGLVGSAKKVIES